MSEHDLHDYRMDMRKMSEQDSKDYMIDRIKQSEHDLRDYRMDKITNECRKILLILQSCNRVQTMGEVGVV